MWIHSYLIPVLLAISIKCNAGATVVAPKAVCPNSVAEWFKARRDSAITLGRMLMNAQGAYYGPWELLEKCRSQDPMLFQSNPQLNACLDDLKGFYTAIGKKSIDEDNAQTLGFNIPDAQYYQQTAEKVALPPMFESAKFLSLIDRVGDGDVRALVESENKARTKKNLPPIGFAHFKTEVGTFDGQKTSRRLFNIQDGNRDLWVNFADAPSRQVSVVSVVKEADGKKRAYFRDYLRKNGKIEKPMRALAGDGCISCHPTGGPNRIWERQGFTAADRQAIRSFNKKMQGYGALSQGPFDFDRSIFPPLGDSPLSPDIQATCLSNIRLSEDPIRANVQKAKIRSAMNCAQCHDGHQQPVLRAPLAPGFFMTYIESGHMPPDTNLSDPEERKALAGCLQQQYFSTSFPEQSDLYRVLTRTPCDTPKNTGSLHRPKESGNSGPTHAPAE